MTCIPGVGRRVVRDFTEILRDGRRVVEEMKEALGVAEGERDAHSLFLLLEKRVLMGKFGD